MKLYHYSDHLFKDGEIVHPKTRGYRTIDKVFDDYFKEYNISRLNALFASQDQTFTQQFGKYGYEVILTKNSRISYCTGIIDLHLRIQSYLYYEIPDNIDEYVQELLLDCNGDYSILEVYLKREESVLSFFNNNFLSNLDLVINNINQLQDEEIYINNEAILNRII